MTNFFQFEEECEKALLNPIWVEKFRKQITPKKEKSKRKVKPKQNNDLKKDSPTNNQIKDVSSELNILLL
jgi:hypothetical protein